MWSIYFYFKRYLAILYIKMINFDDVTGEIIKEHNPNWFQFPDHPYRILSIGLVAQNQEKEIYFFIFVLKIHVKRYINC